MLIHIFSIRLLFLMIFHPIYTSVHVFFNFSNNSENTIKCIEIPTFAILLACIMFRIIYEVFIITTRMQVQSYIIKILFTMFF